MGRILPPRERFDERVEILNAIYTPPIHIRYAINCPRFVIFLSVSSQTPMYVAAAFAANSLRRGDCAGLGSALRFVILIRFNTHKFANSNRSGHQEP